MRIITDFVAPAVVAALIVAGVLFAILSSQSDVEQVQCAVGMTDSVTCKIQLIAWDIQN